MKSNSNLEFIFTPKGFQVDETLDTLVVEQEEWKQKFLENRYRALYLFGNNERLKNISISASFLYQISSSFFRVLTNNPDLELLRDKLDFIFDKDEIQKILNDLPFVVGSEYVDGSWIEHIFSELLQIYIADIKKYDGSVAMYFTELNQHLRVPERVFFHLVESKDDEFPFAFLATYATELENGKVSHMPLAYALSEYHDDQKKLLTLLACLNKAAEASQLIGEFVESGEMFHPLKLTSQEAYMILKDVPAIEEAGVLCRVPNWWKKRQSSVSMSITVGNEKPPLLGIETLISLQPELIVDGFKLTKRDIELLLKQTEGLAFLKGKWVEVDHKRLEKLLEQLDENTDNISLFEAMRLNKINENGLVNDLEDGIQITNGKWLTTFISNLKNPSLIKSKVIPKSFKARLRAYQEAGYTWLNYMNEIGFGACLADDMGLGKTVQVLAFLEKMRSTNKKAKCLLVVPASLLGNWQKEAEKFSPKMPIHLLHGKPAKILSEELSENDAFLTITTYGMVTRINELENTLWDCLIIDEAQAIKNPLTKQTKSLKKIKGKMKIAMTGTPIENNLTNLWSLFDFLNKGLLGSFTEFKQFCQRLEEDASGYARLKAIISPFMLRRLKTDKKIITDLPEKVEVVDYVNLSKKQTVLYRKLVAELADRIEDSEGMERRGMVLAYLTKFKQICNHPDQYLGQEVFEAGSSGKFEMIKDLCETIHEKRERVLVFTQFKEIIEPLYECLKNIFNKDGFIIHGGVSAKKRSEIVESFQGEDYVPFIILSLKAGGTGLNLTKANHVIHFDRWWNPAVENQATDRAYRIGQDKNVMVHKLVSNGTIEEKIDEMINSKKELAQSVIGSTGESWIIEMDNDELLSLLKLD